MKLTWIVILCAFAFLVCFIVDTLWKLLFRKDDLQKSKQAVRPPKRSAGIGIVLIVAAVAVLLFYHALTDTLLLIGCIVAIVLGIILIVSYFSVVIYYDEEQFLYKALGKPKKTFHYSQIRGQRSLMTRSGIQTILFVADEEIPLYSAMDNLNGFLGKAFHKWCQVKGVDADSVENNPRMFTWFPDPEGKTGE